MSDAKVPVSFNFDYEKGNPEAIKAVAHETARLIPPGIYYNIPEEIYHAMPLPSAHKLWTFKEQTPMHYWFNYINPNRPENERTPQMKKGSALHCAVLEPKRYLETVKAAPQYDARTKEGKVIRDQLEEQEKSGVMFLRSEEMKSLEGMVAGLKLHPIANEHLFTMPGDNELTLIWFENGIKLRARLDRVVRLLGRLIDVKSAANLKDYKFGDQAADLGYLWQLTIYQRAWYKLTNETLTPYFYAVESDAPHGVKIIKVPEAALDKETHNFLHVLADFKHCVDSNYWPGYPVVEEEVFTRISYFDRLYTSRYTDLAQDSQALAEVPSANIPN